MKKELIGVIMQAFYGNRTYTELREETMDAMLEGYLSDDWKKFGLKYANGRTVVKIPDSMCVLVYNKEQEKAQLQQKERSFQKDGYVMKPLAVVPELGLEIYSRCFLCRVNAEGVLESIQDADVTVVRKYLAP